MPLLSFLAETLFHGACGWIGHHAVRLLTLGRIEIGHGAGSEAPLAQWIGVSVLLGLASGAWWMAAAG